MATSVEKFRPGHADISYWMKYGIRDYRGGGRSSARETASRVAAGGIAREAIKLLAPDLKITGYMVQMGEKHLDRSEFDWDAIDQNPFWVPSTAAASEWETYLDGIRKSQNSRWCCYRSDSAECASRSWRANLCQARYRSCGGHDVDQRSKGCRNR